MTTPYPTAIAITILATLVFILDIPPLIWHIQNRNLPASSLIVWLLLLNLSSATNAAIWNNNAYQTAWRGYGLCDIQVKFYIASYAAVAGSLVCIMRSLARVMDTKNIELSPSKARQSTDMAVNLSLCWGFPLLEALLHYIVQPHRYDVAPILGCTPTIYPSWAADMLLLIWPPILALLAAYYALLVIHRMHRHRASFPALLTHSMTTRSRFLRLFLLATTYTLVFLPVQIYLFYLNHRYLPHFPYSWSAVHKQGWSAISMLPPGSNPVISPWIYIGAGIIVFLFYGLGRDARKMHRGCMSVMGLGWALPVQTPNAHESTTLSSLGGRAKMLFSPRKGRPRSSSAAALEMDSFTTNTTLSTTSTIEPPTPPRKSHTKDTQTYPILPLYSIGSPAARGAALVPGAGEIVVLKEFGTERG